MSDIKVNINFESNGGSRALAGKNKNLKRKQYIKRKDYFQNKQNQHLYEKGHNHLGKQPCHNGAKSTHKSLPSAKHNNSSSHRTSAVPAVNPTLKPAASTSSSAPLTITVKNTTKQKQSSKSVVFTKTITPGLSPSALRSHTHSAHVSGGSAPFGNPLKYVAMDCEMVGTGLKGRNSELARCSIVSYDGDTIYDKYIKPGNPVTDYRTRWSGITWSHMAKAITFKEAKKEILKILAGKVVIGHAIHNDFKALSYGHPARMTRDTSRIPLLNKKAGFPEKGCASLKRLTKALFNRDIQTGRRGHSSVEDAKATMELYKVVEVEWERTLASKP
ncbi:interferon-stimulated 20 kDa exonuclease-like 2 [Hypomesus transpacificus]|uniref:interferon-stimulated 20 kDa exonuclease-like 2 n=1 Tax=Hypomesus transpacificus TaxID=137520 RepID=UPI001F0756D1|nr:interferon-stimulated 20 kDa exonuclease-like 2 [Hypomesus transpacificus]